MEKSSDPDVLKRQLQIAIDALSEIEYRADDYSKSEIAEVAATATENIEALSPGALRCPWCGGIPDVIKDIAGEWTIKCPYGNLERCINEARKWCEISPETIRHESLCDAIEAWNDRFIKNEGSE